MVECRLAHIQPPIWRRVALLIYILRHGRGSLRLLMYNLQNTKLACLCTVLEMREFDFVCLYTVLVMLGSDFVCSYTIFEIWELDEVRRHSPIGELFDAVRW